MSPAFYGENKKVLDDLPAFLKKNPKLRGSIFITIGNESTDGVDALSGYLKSYAPAIAWQVQRYPEENHFSVTYKSMFDGLKFIYRDWFVDNYDSARMPVKQIISHFEKLSAQLGYPVLPPEDFVNHCGYNSLNAGYIDEAIAIFGYNTRNYPQSANAFDSLGEAYMKKGDREQAIKNYEKSIALDPDNEEGKKILKKLREQK